MALGVFLVYFHNFVSVLIMDIGPEFALFDY
jgi:hypothetical protein